MFIHVTESQCVLIWFKEVTYQYTLEASLSKSHWWSVHLECIFCSLCHSSRTHYCKCEWHLWLSRTEQMCQGCNLYFHCWSHRVCYRWRLCIFTHERRKTIVLAKFDGLATNKIYSHGLSTGFRETHIHKELVHHSISPLYLSQIHHKLSSYLPQWFQTQSHTHRLP